MECFLLVRGCAGNWDPLVSKMDMVSASELQSHGSTDMNQRKVQTHNGKLENGKVQGDLRARAKQVQL